jgi:glycosyltransferase involved in cell wall biosynthesis
MQEVNSKSRAKLELGGMSQILSLRSLDLPLAAPMAAGRRESLLPRGMRVAIIHYWLVTMRGGEKVLESLCRMFPDADIFTHAYAPESVSATIRRHNVRTSFIGRLPRPAKYYKSYLPLMPMALEQLDLRGYDLIISSESGPAKGIVPPPGAIHVCYCHSPMRYIWNMYHDYRDSAGPLKRLAMAPVAHYIRNWDALSSTRVDQYVANSANVRRRVQRYYHRDAEVIHPPVSVKDFAPVAAGDLEDYYLMVGELVGYKRPELAVEAFNLMKRPLVVIGGGEMLEQIRKLAGPTVRVLGPQPFDVLRHHYARCKALVFPGEEDFGIVPVEAMASGRPVLAYRRGGATETVAEGVSGLFFETQTTNALIDGVSQMDRFDVDSDGIIDHARTFSEPLFRERFSTALNRWLEADGR